MARNFYGFWPVPKFNVGDVLLDTSEPDGEKFVVENIDLFTLTDCPCYRLKRGYGRMTLECYYVEKYYKLVEEQKDRVKKPA